MTEARTLRTISIGLGAATAGLGFAALIGWSFRIEVLFKGAPGWIAILPWTALLFAAGGMSLVLQQVRPNWRVGAWLGAFVLVAGTAMTVQRLGGMAAYVDMEHALDPVYAARCGVNINNLLISQRDTGER